MIYSIDTSKPYAIQWGITGDQRILQNVIILFNTFKYEVSYDRTLGLNRDWVDMPAEEAAALLTSQLVELISEREPRATIKNVTYLGTSAKGTIQFKVEVEI